MMLNLWSAFFPGDELPQDGVDRLARSETMDQLRRKMSRVMKVDSVPSIERAIADALKTALDVPLVDPLLAAWRTHTSLASIRKNRDTLTLLELGPHEVSSRHWPRIDVLSDSALLISFPFDLRLEYRLRGVTLEIEHGLRVTRAWIGDCVGDGRLTLGDVELARFDREPLNFPSEIALDASLA
jgi:hypothetical protein